MSCSNRRIRTRLAQGHHQKRIRIGCSRWFCHVLPERIENCVWKNSCCEQGLHDPLEGRLPCFSMWKNAPFIVMIYVGMSHFMDVGNQKRVRIQVCIYRDLRLRIGQYPKVAQPRPTRFSNSKDKPILLPKLATVG